jgi:CubicO group peptidase (beta-lactamase class C family)
MVSTVAKLPLLHQPGEMWEYSVSGDVLGRVVEVVSGMELDRFVSERITGPAQDGRHRPDGQARYLIGRRRPALRRGDYAPFCQMLLNRGELDGVRILWPKTVDRCRAGSGRIWAYSGKGTSFGLGFAVRTDPGCNPVPGSGGDFSWAGVTGMYFWVDPKEHLVAVLMIQTTRAVPIWRQTRTLVYQTLTR